MKPGIKQSTGNRVVKKVSSRPTVVVNSRKVTLAAKVVKEVGGIQKPGQKYEAVFLFQGGDSTGWVDMDTNGECVFELYSFKSVAFLGVRSKLEPLEKSPYHVKFFQNVYQITNLPEDLTVVFVFEG